jgi:hypothetical protein
VRVSRRFLSVAAAAAALAVGGHTAPASAGTEPGGAAVAVPTVGGIALPISCVMDVSGDSTTSTGTINFSGRTQCTAPVAAISSTVSFRDGLFLWLTPDITTSCSNCTSNTASGSWEPEINTIYSLTYSTTITAPAGYTWQFKANTPGIMGPSGCSQSSPTVITCAYATNFQPYVAT